MVRFSLFQGRGLTSEDAEGAEEEITTETRGKGEERRSLFHEIHEKHEKREEVNLLPISLIFSVFSATSVVDCSGFGRGIAPKRINRGGL